MHESNRTTFLASRRVALALAALAAVAGCASDKQPKTIAPPPKYATLGPRDVPAWMKGSILEQVDLTAVEPYRVSNYGLVVMKRPTGDARNIPTNVREYMIREMTKRNFGSKNQPGFETASPERVLGDPRVAVVRVDCWIPPGASKDQRIDAYVSALPDSNTTSLAGGSLYTTDLVPNGANTVLPGTGVDVLANARGYVFVNPAYALSDEAGDAEAKRNLTRGTILDGGLVKIDRPIGLRVRAAEYRLSRMTEKRIDQLLGDENFASAKDEAMVYVRTPPLYRNDWEHFAGVILHTFFRADSGFAVEKAKEIAALAVKPEYAGQLVDMSYAIEALGKPAVPQVESLLYDPNPAVAFAMARAVAWIGDGAAEAALASMARDPSNAYRIRAVETLAALPSSGAINMTLRELLESGDTLVRIAAYEGLFRNDTTIPTKKVGDKFWLDILESDAPPLIYVTRSGAPRIAFLGRAARLSMPAFFTAMNDEFSISDDVDEKRLLSIFYRGTGGSVRQLTTPDVAEIVARLGGEGIPGQPRFDFSYGEIVALLGKLSDGRLLRSGADPSQPANFVIQTAPGAERAIEEAPVIPEGPRPIDSRQPTASANP